MKKEIIKIKAISIHQPHVNNILKGLKTLELRPTKTSHRGDLMICSTRHVYKNDPAKYPVGMAMGIVEVFDCIPVQEIHRRQIYPDPETDPGTKLKGYVWKLRNPRVISPFPVKGQQGFYYLEVDLNDIKPRPILGVYNQETYVNSYDMPPFWTRFFIAIAAAAGFLFACYVFIVLINMLVKLIA